MSNEKLLEEIIDISNLEMAFKQVKKNKGCPGVDNMSILEFEKYMSKNLGALVEDIKSETYKPLPVKIVEIPKDNGSKRMLGIPTVKDRFVQQAISQVLTKIFDPKFSNNSYGFRPRIGAHDALIQAEKYVQKGKEYIVDIDLEKYFDTVNRDKLMYLLSCKISDSRVLRLVSKFLKAGMLQGSSDIDNGKGVPQGGPLSPLLSNIYLDPLDKILEERGQDFCRYADDLQVYCKTRQGAMRVLAGLIRLLESNKFQLKVNQEKSTFRHATDSKFLGYGFRKDETINKLVLSIH